MEVGSELGKDTKALTQFPLVACAQETVGEGDVLEMKTWGFSFGCTSVFSRGHPGHNRNIRTQTGLHCARESLAQGNLLAGFRPSRSYLVFSRQAP